MNSALNAWNKLRVAAKKDPKKAGVLAALVVVMGGMWVKVLGTQSGPAPAGAATLESARAPEVPGTNVPTPGGSSNNTGTTASGDPRATWAAIKLEPVDRNLFLVDFARYERDGKATAAAESDVQQNVADATGEQKSGSGPVDLKKERQILIANLQTQAGELKLQTIVMGAKPRALINDSMVEEGDTVASFRVVKINPRGVVVEREGIKLDVSMPKYSDAMPK